MSLKEEYQKLLTHYISANNVEGTKAILATIPFNQELKVDDFGPLFSQSLKQGNFEIASAFIEVGKLNPVSEANLRNSNVNPFETLFSTDSNLTTRGIHQPEVNKNFKKLFELCLEKKMFDSPLGQAYAIREFPLIFDVQDTSKLIAMGLPLKTEYNGKKYLLADSWFGKNAPSPDIYHFLELLHKKGYDFNEKNNQGESFIDLIGKPAYGSSGANAWKLAAESLVPKQLGVEMPPPVLKAPQFK